MDREVESSATTPHSNDDDNDDENENSDSDMHYERTQNQTQRLDGQSNTPAECGILEAVHVVNFMCHENEKWELSPLINFMCGKNGSGKSAILTGIQICFGGKAAATNRGTNLKSFIRNGASSASVTCYIKNKGVGAYKHDDYGDRISVERHWHITAGDKLSGGFKIRNSGGKVMASTKRDLDELLDYFNLQFDNPLTVLGQDDARTFIVAAQEHQKYKLFLRGVLLEQLDQDYKIIEEQLDNMSPKLRQKAEDMGEKKRQLDVAARRLKESEAYATQRERLHELKHQCIWVQVEEAEAVIEKLNEGIATQEQNIVEEEAKQQDHAAEVDRIGELYDAKKTELEEANAKVRDLKSQRAEVDEKVKEKDKACTAAKGELNAVKQSVNEARKAISAKEKDIEQEEQRLAEIDGGGAARRRRELEGLKTSAEEAASALETHRNALRPLQVEEDDAKGKLATAKEQHAEQHDDLKKRKAKLNEVRKQDTLPDTRFHPRMPQLIQAINRETRFREKPIGPIGKYVTLLEPKWTSIIEKVFGATLSGFVVAHKGDQEILLGLARKIGMPDLRINMPGTRPLDITGREPGQEFLTILRALRIDNEMIRKSLIIAHKIDNSILVEDFKDAQQIMNRPTAQREAYVQSCYTFVPGQRRDGYLLHYKGDFPAQDPVKTFDGPLRMNADLADQIRLHETSVQEAENSLDRLEEDVRACQSDYNKCKEAVARNKRLTAQMKAAQQTAEQQIEDKQGEIDQDDVAGGTLDQLRDSLRQLNLDLQTQTALYMDAVNASDTAKTEQRDITEEADQAKRQVVIGQAAADAVKHEMQKADQDRSAATATANVATNRITSLREDKASFERQLVTDQQELDELMTGAETAGSARVPIPEGETSASLDLKWDRLLAQVQNAERVIGGSHVDIQKRALEAAEGHRVAKDQYSDLANLQRTLKGSVRERKRRWEFFRKSIGVSARSSFIHLLAQRGFRGKLILDHQQKMLDTKIEPDITEKDSTGRNAKTLSGGEKSYAQLCLLLALWEAMGSPIRCLDEFDVFMDAVARNLAISTILDSARSSHGRQYIMISPGSKSDITPAADIHAFE